MVGKIDTGVARACLRPLSDSKDAVPAVVDFDCEDLAFFAAFRPNLRFSDRMAGDIGIAIIFAVNMYLMVAYVRAVLRRGR